MKIKLLAASALLFAASCRLLAAPLQSTAAVHTKPDASSPAITYLKAGTDPKPASGLGTLANTPAGWMAVDLPGPFEGWVESKDLSKNLDVNVGAPIRLAPKADAPVITLGAKSDETKIIGVRGKWTQIKLERGIVGYINLGGTSTYVPPIATAPATNSPADRKSSPAPRPVSPSPVSPGVYGVATPGQAAPMVNLGDGGASGLPRQFAGRLVSTRRPLTPRRPYDYALNDDAGKRYAYVDVSKLLQTDQIEKYVDRTVVVYGTAKASADGRDIVIQVETLQLK